MDDALRRAKLAKFIEIESYESFEKLAVGRNYSFNNRTQIVRHACVAHNSGDDCRSARR